MQVNKENIRNLTGLWGKYGVMAIEDPGLTGVHANNQWPHRLWFDNPTLNLAKLLRDRKSWIESLNEKIILSVWPDVFQGHSVEPDFVFLEAQLIEHGWHCTFQQVAMYKTLPDQACAATTPFSLSSHGFRVVLVNTVERCRKWVEVASDAFGYDVELSAIERLIKDREIKILLVEQEGQPVASALLYKTASVIGLHQFGVKQAFQGQGIARLLMKEILDICSAWQGQYLVLQASDSGKPLYDNLGFVDQFLIKNFQKV